MVINFQNIDLAACLSMLVFAKRSKMYISCNEKRNISHAFKTETDAKRARKSKHTRYGEFHQILIIGESPVVSLNRNEKHAFG